MHAVMVGRHGTRAGAMGRGHLAVEFTCPRRDEALEKASSEDGPMAQSRAGCQDLVIKGTAALS